MHPLCFNCVHCIPEHHHRRKWHAPLLHVAGQPRQHPWVQVPHPSGSVHCTECSQILGWTLWKLFCVRPAVLISDCNTGCSDHTQAKKDVYKSHLCYEGMFCCARQDSVWGRVLHSRSSNWASFNCVLVSETKHAPVIQHAVLHTP